MSRYIKQLLQGELEKRLRDEKVREFLVLGTIGIEGTDNNVMRGELKKKGIKLFVIRNSLAKKAFANLDMVSAGTILEGPCSVAYGTLSDEGQAASIVDIVREMLVWCKKLPVIKVKGAFLDGQAFGADEAVELSKMPNLAELQARIIGIIRTPASNLAGAIISPASIIAGCLKTIIDKEPGKEAA